MKNRLPQTKLIVFCRRAILIFLGSSLLAPLWAEPVRMTLLSPAPDKEFWFWNETIRFMRAVADDLGVEFNVVATEGTSTYSVKKDGLAIINQKKPPDYILTGYWNESVEELMAASQDRGIRFFLINTPITEAGKQRVEQPRSRFKHWIGQMHPDEAGAGYELARILLDRAKTLEKNANSAIHVAGLSGDELSSVSAARESGFRRAARESNAILHSVIGTSWRREVAERATATVLEQHPDTSAIWTVTDPAALGVIDELKKRGLRPGVDVLTGGFDWSEEGVEAVRRGEMVATMGGHFMEGGWAIILAYDYHHGKDFADELGTTIFSSLQAVTPANVDHYTDLIKQQDVDKIDFRELSKTYNSKLDKYDFSIESLLERLRNRKKVPAGEH